MPDDIGSVDRFETPTGKGKDKDHSESEDRPKDREDNGRYEDGQEYEHDVPNKSERSRNRERKRENRKHRHEDEYDEDEPEDEYDYDRGHSSSYTYSDVDRESTSSPSTSSHPKKATEMPREEGRDREEAKQPSRKDRRERGDEDDEPRRSDRDRDPTRPQQLRDKHRDKDSRISKQSRTEPKVRNHQQKGKESHIHSKDTNIFLRGPILHSSQLDTLTPELLKGKNVVIIGSGASAVEAVEIALERGCEVCSVLARDDKVRFRSWCWTDEAYSTVNQWIIPRNILFDTLIAAQPFGREMPLR